MADRYKIEVVKGVQPYIIETKVDAIDSDFLALRFETVTLSADHPLRGIPQEGILIGMNLQTAQRLKDELEQQIAHLVNRMGKRIE